MRKRYMHRLELARTEESMDRSSHDRVQHSESRPCKREHSARVLCFIWIACVTIAERFGLAHSSTDPPYLYVTFHGGFGKNDINNIYKYSRDGAFLGKVLEEHLGLKELRGIDITVSGTVLVANAHADDSKIIEFGLCLNDKQMKRAFKRVLVPFDPDYNPGMSHPYGIAVGHHDGYIYVSMQNTNSILRFDYHGDPAPTPLALNNTKDAALYPGVFVLLKWDEEVRDIAFDASGFLYVANKQRGLLVFDTSANFVDSDASVITPIGVHYDKRTHRLYVGASNGKKSKIHEYQTDDGKLRQIGTFSHKKLSHPAGIVTDDTYLYVISQDTGEILRFFLENRSLDKVIIKKLPDIGEQLFMSPC